MSLIVSYLKFLLYYTCRFSFALAFGGRFFRTVELRVKPRGRPVPCGFSFEQNLNFFISFNFYKNYFSEVLNLQKNSLRVVTDISKIDINLEKTVYWDTKAAACYIHN
jgi:hypothetical protein